MLAEMRFVGGREGALCGDEAASLWAVDQEHDVIGGTVNP